ncbi:hypothetical protein PaeBR_15855 [Paenibacillus sp. BR2-3]|uniref:hypothetical protein n=1 Tax=Paenibacillus sp. BR2-3 TaxID=3048494 RepID=UPI00397768CD
MQYLIPKYKDEVIIIFNHIKVEKLKSQYIQDEHYNIVIDGIAFDVRLNEFYPNNHYLGLIPVMIDWLSSEEERKLAQSRYRSTMNPEILPILMCPDDCDLYCTVIVAEVMIKDEEIIWNRIGLDTSQLSNNIEDLGEEVQWLGLVPTMRFKKEEYYYALNLIYNLEDEQEPTLNKTKGQ